MLFNRKKFVRKVTNYLHKKQKSPHTIEYGDIRVYPTAVGMLYFSCIVAMFLLGINYQNNFILMVCCILISVIPFALIETYKNLRGITFEAMDTERFFAGQSVRFRLHVSTERVHHAISVEGINNEAIGEFCDKLDNGYEVGITYHPQERGYLYAQGFVITTVFPLGIFCAHSVIDFEQKTLIYPRQLTGLYHLTEIASDKSSKISHNSNTIKGMDELAGLRPYRPGEPISLIAWKQLAMQRGFLAKDFTATVDDSNYLDIDQIPGTLEEKLSVMTYACIQLTALNMIFGLKLGTEMIEPAQGQEHCNLILERLALYGK